jgi:DNA-binding transcriptional ArsR family regulator
MRHPVQQQILDELAKGPADAAQLAKVIGKHQTTIRQHLQALRKAKLVKCRRGWRTRSGNLVGNKTHKQLVMVAELAPVKQ